MAKQAKHVKQVQSISHPKPVEHAMSAPVTLEAIESAPSEAVVLEGVVVRDDTIVPSAPSTPERMSRVQSDIRKFGRAV